MGALIPFLRETQLWIRGENQCQEVEEEIHKRNRNFGERNKGGLKGKTRKAKGTQIGLMVDLFVQFFFDDQNIWGRFCFFAGMGPTVGGGGGRAPPCCGGAWVEMKVILVTSFGVGFWIANC